MKLNPQEANSLNLVWNALYDGYALSADLRNAFNAMEAMRPGGGFSEYIDEELFCMCCGMPKKPQPYRDPVKVGRKGLLGLWDRMWQL